VNGASPVIRSSLVLLLCFVAIAGVARADPSPSPLVAVPFGCGLAFPVTQVHAVGTHVDNDVWAWDFRMPEGTPVVAALDGVVRLARGDSTEGGCDPALAATANYVVLEHAGGLESQYLHFSRVTVQAGQHVKQGELLGYSGKTGWACGPHLHFKMAHPEGDGWNNPSVAARIEGYGDPPLGTRVSSPACPGPATITAGAAPSGASSGGVGGALLPSALTPAERPASGTPVPALAGARASGAAPASVPSVAPVMNVPSSPVSPGREPAPARPEPATPSAPRLPAPASTVPVHAAS
jgi:murein DD-endopeptidase MepM/ murein hydrolase activator NlpD